VAILPSEKTYVGIPLVEQLKGGWNHIEGDIDAPHPRRRAIPQKTQTSEKGPHA